MEKIAVLNNIINDLRLEIKELKFQLNLSEKDANNKENTIKELRTRFNTNKSVIVKLQEDLKRLKEDKKIGFIKTDGISGYIDYIKFDESFENIIIKDLEKTINTMKADLIKAKANYNNKFTNINLENIDLQNEIKKLKHKLETIEIDHKEELNKIYKEHSVESTNLIKEFEEYKEEKLKVFKKDLDQINNKVSDFELKLSKFIKDSTSKNIFNKLLTPKKQKLDELRNDIRELTDYVYTLKRTLKNNVTTY